MGALRESTLVDNSKLLLQKILNLKQFISNLKEKYGLTTETIKNLSKLQFDETKYSKITKRITDQERIRAC